VSPIEIGLMVIVMLMSIALLALILLHKGKGGGLSDMFGGGMSTSLGGSNVVERNLDRMTIAAGIVWFACIVGLNLLLGSN
jgi:preprotein translocase subunit SecG